MMLFNFNAAKLVSMLIVVAGVLSTAQAADCTLRVLFQLHDSDIDSAPLCIYR
jgi:hypothetical protein